MKKESIYLDYHATTPVDPEVLQAMIPYFTNSFGNPASQHKWGWDGAEVVENARTCVANFLGCSEKEVVFTGGATEATNIALFGLFEQYKNQNPHIITTNAEHKSVLSICEELQNRGAELSILETDSEGLVSAQQVEAAIKPNTLFVSVIFANNEIGSINPIGEIGAICKKHSVFFHCDAVQAIGKIPVNVEDLKIDLLSLTAHKIYGPKGTGALYIRSKNPKVSLKPFLLGGGHENGRRSGTLNVPGIVGLGKSIEMLSDNKFESERNKLFEQRALLQETVTKSCQKHNIGFQINGPKNLDFKLPNNLSISFEGIDAALLKTALRNIAYSTGSACSTANAAPSHVLKAIGLSDELAKNTMRLSTGRFTTKEVLDQFVGYFDEAIAKAKTENGTGLDI